MAIAVNTRYFEVLFPLTSQWLYMVQRGDAVCDMGARGRGWHHALPTAGNGTRTTTPHLCRGVWKHQRQ